MAGRTDPAPPDGPAWAEMGAYRMLCDKVAAEGDKGFTLA